MNWYVVAVDVVADVTALILMTANTGDESAEILGLLA